VHIRDHPLAQVLDEIITPRFSQISDPAELSESFRSAG
jgi:hypothetical protein